MSAIETLIKETKHAVVPRSGIVVTGHKKHGKDTVCSLIQRFSGLESQSSSRYALYNLDLMERLKERGLDYASKEDAYNDRDNHREIWFEEIRDINLTQDYILGKRLLSEVPIYNGIRNREELERLVHLGYVRSIVWVDAGERLPPEGKGSMTVTRDDATHVIDNNKTFTDLLLNVSVFCLNYLERETL